MEGQAAFYALLMTCCMGFDKLLLEINCATLYQSLIKDASTCSWIICIMFEDIKFISSQFLSCTFNLVPCELNRATKSIIKKILDDRLPLG